MTKNDTLAEEFDRALAADRASAAADRARRLVCLERIRAQAEAKGPAYYAIWQRWLKIRSRWSFTHDAMEEATLAADQAQKSDTREPCEPCA